MSEPEVLLLLGVPDDMNGTLAAGQPFSLRGNTGLAAALVDALRQKNWPLRMHLLRPGAAPPPAGARLLLNAVCEPVIHRRSLALQGQLERRTGLPTLNPTWVIAHSGRAAIARRLSHQVGVQVPLCTVFRRDRETLPQHVARLGHRYPVLLRPLGQHGSDGLQRIDDEKHAAVATGLEAGHVTDWVDFKSKDGCYRKHRLFLAGDTLVRRHLLIDQQWNITVETRSFMKDRPDLVEEEKRWLERPVDLAAGSVESRLLHQFRALQLDFGSVDYSLLSGGEVLVFEINACIQVTGNASPEEAARWPHIKAINGTILDAVCDLIRKRAASARTRQPLRNAATPPGEG